MMLPWVSNLDDPIFPFAVGIFQFSTISYIGVDQLMVWWLMMSALALVAMNHYSRLFRALKSEPEVAAYRQVVSLRTVYWGLGICATLAALNGVLSNFSRVGLEIAAGSMAIGIVSLVAVLAAWLRGWKRVVSEQ